MMKMWIVDAFTNEVFKGNPAGVTIVEEFPSDELCQKIAIEMNHSETAFVKPLGKNHFHLRWFTPGVEVKLCGHATLAAAHILKQEKLVDGEVLFDSLSGPLKVYLQDTKYTLDFPLQATGNSLDLGEIFGKNTICVQAYDDIIVELPTETEVINFQPNYDEIEKIECRGVIITAKGSGKYDFVSRFFCPKVGLREDPVTGSAHCKLADYWQNKLHKKTFLAYQASQRGGEIAVSIVGNRVHLIGQAVTTLAGEFFY